MSKNKEIMDKVVACIVQAIEDAPTDLSKEWRMPWHNLGHYGTPKNYVSKREYRGVNIFVLAITAMSHGWDQGLWATYKQWASKGGQVRKGERATQIVFWKFLEKPKLDAEGEPVLNENEEPIVETVPIAWLFSVFNIDQVDGIQKPRLPVNQHAEIELRERAETLVAATGAVIRENDGRAFYHPSDDFIGMPRRELFRDTAESNATENYYSTLLHELTHWTGHESRLNRKQLCLRGSEDYAYEELVAELGAAALCMELGVTIEPRPDHAQYVAGWLKALKDDSSYVYRAARDADKAAQFVLKHEGVQQEEAA